MLRLAYAMLAMALLSGCKPSASEEAWARQNLPITCDIRYLGAYGGIANLVVVVCDGRRSVTTSWNEKQGKSTRQITSVFVEAPDERRESHH